MESYISREAQIVAKAQANGISAQELNAVFESILGRVTQDYGGRSAEWRLGRSEFLVWSRFFPGEPFPNASATDMTSKEEIKHEADDPASPFPKALHGKTQSKHGEATGREWVHDRYQENTLRSSDSYRPQQQLDSYRPQAQGENKAPGKISSFTIPFGRSSKMATAGGGQVRSAILESLPNGAALGIPYRSQSDLINRKAVEEGIPVATLIACLEEKASIADTKFNDRSGDWQMYFVEASVWGRFFTGPFPGIEPSKYPAQPAKVDSTPTVAATAKLPSSEYSGSVCERLMEKKAIKLGLRREFFRYLQKMRTYSKMEHKSEGCASIRGWFADNLTWQNFFEREKFPFDQPPLFRNTRCKACLLLPKFAPFTQNTIDKVLKKVYDSTANKVVKAPTKVNAPEITKGVTGNSAMVVSQPGPMVSNAGLSAPAPASRTLTQQVSTALQPPASSMSRRSLRTPPPGLSTQPVNAKVDLHPQSLPPAHLSTQLAQMWQRDPFLGKGTVIMQNTFPAVFNKILVGEIFSCFGSDTKNAIEAIGAELKCHIYYYVASTGDLFLWNQPHVPGDAVSFNRGHMFITGWVTRVSSFGMVKPSVHWNSIRTPLAPIIKPANTVDALSRLASYVQAAAADKPAIETHLPANLPENPKSSEAHGTSTPILSGTNVYPPDSNFETPEMQWARYKAAFRISDIDRLVLEETVKNEAGLRIVLDKETGEIISVDELVKRSVYRGALSKGSRNEAKAQVGSEMEGLVVQGDLVTLGDLGMGRGEKRKVDDGDDDDDDAEEGEVLEGRGEKRVCF